MLQPQQETDTTLAHAESCSTPDLRQEAQMQGGLDECCQPPLTPSVFTFSFSLWRKEKIKEP